MNKYLIVFIIAIIWFSLGIYFGFKWGYEHDAKDSRNKYIKQIIPSNESALIIDPQEIYRNRAEYLWKAAKKESNDNL